MINYELRCFFGLFFVVCVQSSTFVNRNNSVSAISADAGDSNGTSNDGVINSIVTDTTNKLAPPPLDRSTEFDSAAQGRSLNETEVIVYHKISKISRRKGRVGLIRQSGNNHHRPVYNVYSIPGPQPPPVVPINPTFPPTIVITTTQGPPAPFIPAPIQPGPPAPIQPGPPSPLLPGPPAPLSDATVTGTQRQQSAPSNGALANNIKCAKDAGYQMLSATIMRPFGFSSQPVFNDASHVNPVSDSKCRISSIPSTRQYQLRVSDFNACGAKSHLQGADKKEWMSLTVRFPYVNGLRLAEDEYIMLMCRPQDRTIVQNHALNLRGNVARATKNVFSSGPQLFICDIALFRVAKAGSAEKITSGTTIEIGEKLQLRGEVRSGDGWKYARLTDVIVKRVQGSQESATTYQNNANNVAYASSSNQFSAANAGTTGYRNRRAANSQQQSTAAADTAFLVFSDGCRNPTYKAVAPYHPWRDETNLLAVNFLFKAFMFQNMRDGDSIRVTARVMACVNEYDCKPKSCSDDGGHGMGRRKREVPSDDHVRYYDITQEVYRNGTVKKHTLSNVTRFDQDLDLVIVTPGHLQKELQQKTVEAQEARESVLSSSSSKCNLYLITTAVLTATLCLSVLVSVVLVVKNKRNVNKKSDANMTHRRNEMQQVAVVAAAAAAATAANQTVYSSTNYPINGYSNESCNYSDVECYDGRHTTRRSKVSDSKRSRPRSCSQNRCRRRSYSSDETDSEDTDCEMKCSVV